MSISGLREKHKRELEKLSLTSQPLKTLKFFTLAIFQHISRSTAYVLTHGFLLMLLVTAALAAGVLFVTGDGPHTKHVEVLLQYLQFVLWWVALGIASSIGLGSGLHTFVLYLGPHIAFFTIKAMQCSRVDLKSAPYDTIQLNRSPTWLNKDCSEFGPPLFSSQVPVSIILPHVQIESMLWGLGTAIGELPPYFISRAASISGGKADELEELDSDCNGVSSTINQLKRWFLSHAQYLNFFTILLLASVPNPLFDLAGIMCGQFGIPFWKFFLSTLIGKAIIKSHIQTVFIIAVCNNQLFDWVENELIRMLSFIPGFASFLPKIIAKLHAVKDKYMTAPPPQVTSNIKVESWDLSLSTVWNSIIWLMLLNFFSTIISSTAQSYLKKQQEKEMALLKNKLEQLNHTD